MRAILALSLVASSVLPVFAEVRPKMPDTPVSAEDPCGATAYRHLIGQPGSVARALEIDQPMRVVPFRAAVTMDMLPGRINFYLDEEGNISRIQCG